MARPLRIEFSGAIYHVTARGNAREAIVHDDDDRDLFLHTLGEVVTRLGWLCHADPATVGAVAPPSSLSTRWLLSQFAKTRSVAHRRYAEFVAQGRNLPYP